MREIGLHGGLIRLSLFADDLGIRDDLREAVAAGAGPTVPRWRAAVGHILADELDAAADLMESAGNPTIEANLRKHAGLRLLAAGHARGRASSSSARSRSTARSTRRPTSREIESALAGAQSESA